jgi:hypothetical protein
MAAIYDIGDLVRFSVAFADLSGAAADPTSVTVKIKDPAGEEAAYVHGVDAEVIRDSLGAFHIDLELTAAGPWWQRWEGSGAVTATEEGYVRVRKSAFTPEGL